MTDTKSKSAKLSPGFSKIIIGISLLFLFAIGAYLIPQKPISAAEIVVYKSPTCGCCKDWVTHMEENGFSVKVHNQLDLSDIKKEYGVPPRMQSCHTAKINGYVIEGHVPADLVRKLLDEKPKVIGLAVPGMPMGSPGMEGPRKDPYDVVTFDEQGQTTIYASR